MDQRSNSGKNKILWNALKKITCPLGECIKAVIRRKCVAFRVIWKEKDENYVNIIFKKLKLKKE